ncbi:MAG: DUF6781 family protein [Planctomycetota bacterium]
MDPAAETRRIVDEGKDIADRVRRLTRDTLAAGMGAAGAGAQGLGDLATRVFNAAAEAANRKPEDGEARSAMNDVVDGFAAGLNEAAEATKETLNSAAESGQKFAKEDLKRATDDLEAVRQSLMQAVTSVAGGIKGMVEQEASALKDRVKTAAETAKPKVEQAAKAASEHPGEVAGETVASAMHAGAAAVGVLGQAVSGALSGLGDMIAERSKPGEKAADEASETNTESEAAPEDNK